MFTGIIQQTATITDLKKTSHHLIIEIKTSWNDLVEGESIAVDGMCLTVEKISTNTFRSFISPESSAISIAVQYQCGQLINLERAMQVHERIGGHCLTGHIDHTLRVHKIIHHDPCLEIIFGEIPQLSRGLIVSKGSIAINGVSLTINKINEGFVSVMLIPHTLAHTNLKNLQCDDDVNVEYDYLAKLIQRQWLIYMEKKEVSYAE